MVIGALDERPESAWSWSTTPVSSNTPTAAAMPADTGMRSVANTANVAASVTSVIHASTDIVSDAAELPGDEGQHVGLLGDLLADRLALAVSGATLLVQQHRALVLACAGRLQPSCHLAGV